VSDHDQDLPALLLPLGVAAGSLANVRFCEKVVVTAFS